MLISKYKELLSSEHISFLTVPYDDKLEKHISFCFHENFQPTHNQSS